MECVTNKNLNSYRYICRPSILQKETKLIMLLFLIIGIGVVCIISIQNKHFSFQYLWNTVLCLLVSSVSLLIGIYYKLTISIYIYPNKIGIKGLLFSGIYSFGSYNEITFENIKLIYYAEREAEYLLNLKEHFKKYKISKNEYDYSPNNLASKYGIPITDITNYNNSKFKNISEDNIASLQLFLEEIYYKYNVSKRDKKVINKSILNITNLTKENVLKLLSNIQMTEDDIQEIDSIIDIVNNTKTSQFYYTKINFKKYNPDRIEHYSWMAEMLVLSDYSGKNKIYLEGIYRFNKNDYKKIISTIITKSCTPDYLMTKSEKKALFRTSSIVI